MKFLKISVVIAALAMMTGSVAYARTTVFPGDTIIELATTPRMLGAGEDFPGMWEYVYDVVGTTDAGGQNRGWGNNAWLSGFDSDLMVNRWKYGGFDPDGIPNSGDEYTVTTPILWDGVAADSANYVPKQNWTAASAGHGTVYNLFINAERWPSLAVPVPMWPGGPNTLAWAQPKDVLMSWNSISYLENANPGVVNQAWYVDNPWHAGSEYSEGESVWSSSAVDAGGDGISFRNTNGNLSAFYGLPDLLLTFRVVHPNPPGDITWGTYHNGAGFRDPGADDIYGTADDIGPDGIDGTDDDLYVDTIRFLNYGPDGIPDNYDLTEEEQARDDVWTSNPTATITGTITGPSQSVGFDPGDVDEDGDIDADDIDLMGDYIRTGIAPTTANYDLSDDGATGGTDGNIDLDDLDYLVRFLVETSAVDGGGNPIFGTQYGDFNLDGEIELGDLTRLGTYYGVGDKWAEGNANPHLDMLIELGDLTILGTYYGASNGGVDTIPEPMTMSLLALGGLAVIRKRRKS